MNRDEMVQYIDNALRNYASEIDWNLHPPNDKFWHLEGAINYSLIRATNAKKILEIGTGYGNSTKFIAEVASKNGVRAITIEINQVPEYMLQAKANLKDFAVDLYNMDAKDFKYDGIYDFVFIDGNHSEEMFDWYYRDIFLIVKGWLGVHDIDINPDITDTGNAPESLVYRKTLAGKYVTAREMYGHTEYRPPTEGADSRWMNGSSYIYLGE